ncbi:MAG: ATP-dependent helicase, partial [Gammaproteobacteria bacterium]
DEFQDTNRLQFEWLKLLDSGDNAFFAVGDDDQSIYSFRGTRPENMRDFQSQLRAATIIRLEQNYRSTAKILSAANKLIARNKGRLGKTLSAVCGEGEPVQLRVCATDLDEASAIASGIMLATESGAENADDIAVLYRTNAQSRVIEQKMMESGIAYRIYGGTRFFDRMEVKHALAYMRLAVSMDTDALLRVINFPPRGIGKIAMTQLALTAQKEGWENAIFGGEHRGLRSFGALLAELRTAREEMPLGELARAAVEKSGLMAHYESRKAELERAENLREFVNAAAQFQSSDDDPLMQFLANAALESGDADSPLAAGAAVSLMTVHAAKGLEFGAVFVAGLEEGLFPHANSLDNGNALEEERRLMYVAITRARRMLVLHYARSRLQYGTRQSNPYSRFLDELECFRQETKLPQQQSQWFKPASKTQIPQMPQRQTTNHPANETPLPANGITPSATSGAFRPGSSVRHRRYGLGVVLGISGDGGEITIAFKLAGKKTFKTALAKLQKVA